MQLGSTRKLHGGTIVCLARRPGVRTFSLCIEQQYGMSIFDAVRTGVVANVRALAAGPALESRDVVCLRVPPAALYSRLGSVTDCCVPPAPFCRMGARPSWQPWLHANCPWCKLSCRWVPAPLSKIWCVPADVRVCACGYTCRLMQLAAVCTRASYACAHATRRVLRCTNNQRAGGQVCAAGGSWRR